MRHVSCLPLKRLHQSWLLSLTTKDQFSLKGCEQIFVVTCRVKVVTPSKPFPYSTFTLHGYSKAPLKPWLFLLIPNQLYVSVLLHTVNQQATPWDKSGTWSNISSNTARYALANTQSLRWEHELGLRRQREAPVFLALPGCGGVRVCASVFETYK